MLYDCELPSLGLSSIIVTLLTIFRTIGRFFLGKGGAVGMSDMLSAREIPLSTSALFSVGIRCRPKNLFPILSM